jgi:hypothetical protein
MLSLTPHRSLLGFEKNAFCSSKKKQMLGTRFRAKKIRSFFYRQNLSFAVNIPFSVKIFALFCRSQLRPGLPDGIHICIPKIPIRVYFRGPWNEMFWFILCKFVLHIVISLGNFCILSPFWNVVPREIWQPCLNYFM